MPTANKGLDARYDAAKGDAARAAKEDSDVKRAESKLLLDGLLRKSVAERFRAVADSGPKLFRVHRRELMRSLQSEAPAKRTIAAATASRFEIWRSRLRHRRFALAMVGFAVVTILILGVTAYRHTPQRWVTVKSEQDLPVSWVGLDGETSNGTIKPESRYVLSRIEGDLGVLQIWVANRGYLEIRLPVKFLQTD
jgi:hypothetical protein